MYIKSIVVTGLFGKPESLALELNRDLNIITGRNGSGKTTILKLAWFIISGNILLALREIKFNSCFIETSEYKCTVVRTGLLHCKVELDISGERKILEDDESEDQNEEFNESAEDKANPILMSKGESIFFPTFRRIEGGFSMTSGRMRQNRNIIRSENDIDESLSTLSRRLSNKNHIFVSAISTQDIVSLLLRRYALYSEEINSYQEGISRNVIEKIKHYQRGESSYQNANNILSETRDEIEKIEKFRTETMKPLDAVRDLVKQLFQHSGISFDKRLKFGEAAAAIDSDSLSAGEKQLLSFICYNAFSKNSIVFIDEPELSLHVDWQRRIYQILSNQGSENQFIFATHSPFIYAKYPDKEVSFNLDRGE